MTYKKVRITTDYGMSDYYDYYTKNNNLKISSAKYNKLITELNKNIVDLIINDNLEFKPTKLQFTFCIRKIKKVPRIIDGKLINTTPIDFKATKELWDKNPEAKEKKILLRYLNTHSFKYVFRIKGIKSGNTYKNKNKYKYKPARSFQRSLAKRIFNNDMDNFDAYNLF